MNEAPSRPAKGFRSLWGIIVRPRATFRYLNEEGRRQWWLPALLTVLLVLLPIIVGGPISARQARETVRIALHFSVNEAGPGRPVVQTRTQLSPEQQQQMEEAMRHASSPLIIVVFPAILRSLRLVVGWLAWAGLLYLSGMVIGGHARFGNLFRMVVWAWIPHALRGLLQTLYIALSGQLIAHPGLSGLVVDSRPINEMLTAPPTTGQILLSSLLTRIDIFVFWNLALLAVGTMVISRISGRKATATVLIIWVVLTALGLLSSLVSRSFGM